MREESESEVPECLNRRYQAVDEMIREISAMSHRSSQSGPCSASDPGVKLMCKFWNILKEEPNCNLPAAVHRCMYLSDDKSSNIKPQRVCCYMANEEPRGGSSRPGEAGGCVSDTAPPLSKVLCNLKEAATFDRDCNRKLKDLLAVEKQLRCQIAHLENREKEGIALLKKADDMWSNMENAYKEKIAESLERQRDLVKQLHEIEMSAAKWRRNKKDLESQLQAINKCQLDMTEKINQKTNDLKTIDAEIAGYKTRIEKTKKETEATKKQLTNKKTASDGRLSKICQEITKLEKSIQAEAKLKQEKEKEGNAFIKEAREDLQKMCKMLLQKKLEHEDLKAEKVALIQEINMLKDTCLSCRERCTKKEVSIFEEIKKVDTEIYNFKLKCVKCNVCVDTSEARKFCTDCPRCLEQRECLMEGDSCCADAKEECVCLTVKQRFLDNVFENMYTVLEKQIRTDAGKVVADEIADCLKKSRNGKLNEHTRRILQEFILTTVKKNLNLTIVGGAVKTRCELDTAMYEQLMLCLKKVKATPTPKSDKGTNVKKDPCSRWGGASECNCPKGPKACICGKKAPPPPKDPTPCPPPEKEDAGETVVCPHKQNVACGPDCGAHTPNRVGKDVAKWRPDPCAGQSCPFGQNMRAAQCVLGPESLIEPMKFGVPVPRAPSSVLKDQIECRCGNSPMKPCACTKDQKSIPRQQIIEEVMGRYLDVTPIEKVANIHSFSDLSVRTYEDCFRLNTSSINLATNTIVNKLTQSTKNPTQYELEDVWIRKAHEKGTNEQDSYSKKDAKKVSFLRLNCVSTSQQIFPSSKRVPCVSNRINVTHNVKHIEKSVSGYQVSSCHTVTTGFIGSDSSKNMQPMNYHVCSKSQTEIKILPDDGARSSNCDTFTLNESVNNEDNENTDNIWKKDKYTITKENCPLKVDTMMKYSTLKRSESSTDIYIRESFRAVNIVETKYNNKSKKSFIRTNRMQRPCNFKNRNVTVLTNKNKEIEDFFKITKKDKKARVKIISADLDN